MNTRSENSSQFNLDQIHSQTQVTLFEFLSIKFNFQLQDFTAEQEQGVELQAEIIDGPEGAMLVLPEGTELNAGGQYVIVIDGEEMQVNVSWIFLISNEIFYQSVDTAKGFKKKIFNN